MSGAARGKVRRIGGFVSSDVEGGRRDQSQNTRPTVLRRWLSNFVLLILILVSYVVGAILAVAVLLFIQLRTHWALRGGDESAMFELGGAVFGVLPAYLVAAFMLSRRLARRGGEQRRRGFDVGGPAHSQQEHFEG